MVFLLKRALQKSDSWDDYIVEARTAGQLAKTADHKVRSLTVNHKICRSYFVTCQHSLMQLSNEMHLVHQFLHAQVPCRRITDLALHSQPFTLRMTSKLSANFIFCEFLQCRKQNNTKKSAHETTAERCTATN